MLLHTVGSYFIFYYLLEFISCCSDGQYQITDDGKCFECKDLIDNGHLDSFMENCWPEYHMIVRNIKGNNSVHENNAEIKAIKCINSNDCEHLLEMCNFATQLCEPCSKPKSDTFRRWSQCYSKALLFLKSIKAKVKPENLNVPDAQDSTNILIGVIVGGVLFIIIFAIGTWLVYQKYVVKPSNKKIPEMENLTGLPKSDRMIPPPLPPANQFISEKRPNTTAPIRLVFNPQSERIEDAYHVYETPITRNVEPLENTNSHTSELQLDTELSPLGQRSVPDQLQSSEIDKLSIEDKLNAVFQENPYFDPVLYVAGWTISGILTHKEKQMIMDDRTLVTDQQKQEKIIQILCGKSLTTLQLLAKDADKNKHPQLAASFRHYFGE